MVSRCSQRRSCCTNEDRDFARISNREPLNTAPPEQEVFLRTRGNTFNLLNLNIQCLSNKVGLVELVAAENDAHFLCISEHWLERDYIDNLDILGYKKISAFSRIRKDDHGGTAIYARAEISHLCKNLQKYVDLSSEYDIECSAILFDRKHCILCLYRSQVGDLDIFVERLSCILDHIISGGHLNVIICGDFNVDNLGNSNNLDILNDLFISNGLRNIINEPTRIARNNKGDLVKSGLDYICTNIPSSDIVVCRNFQPAISDHHMQLLSWAVRIDSGNAAEGGRFHTKTFQTRMVNSNLNISHFKRIFCSIDNFCSNFSQCIESVAMTSNIDHYFDAFWQHLSYCFSAAFPLIKRKVPVRSPKIRFSPALRHELENLKDLNRLRKTYDDRSLDGLYRQKKTT